MPLKMMLSSPRSTPSCFYIKSYKSSPSMAWPRKQCSFQGKRGLNQRIAADRVNMYQQPLGKPSWEWILKMLDQGEQYTFLVNGDSVHMATIRKTKQNKTKDSFIISTEIYLLCLCVCVYFCPIFHACFPTRLRPLRPRT